MNAQRALEKLIPNEDLRKELFEHLAKTIRRAHQENPAGWSLHQRVKDHSVNLNVGKLPCFAIFMDGVELLLAAPNLSVLKEKAPVETVYENPASLSGVGGYQVDLEHLSEVWGDLEQSHFEAIAKAAEITRTPYFSQHSPEVLEVVAEAVEGDLPTPSYGEVPISAHQKRKLLDLLRLRYPDWKGLRDPDFVQDEIEYKRETIRKARERISEDALEQLLQQEKYDVIVDRLDQLGKDNNLLYRAVPMSGDLGILYQEKLDKRRFCQEFFDLIYGDDPTIERLERYLAWVDENRLPNKWTFPTYFLFLCHPEEEIFIKPQVTRRALELLGFRLKLKGRPDIEEYAEVVGIASRLLDAFAEEGAEDMVDVQSLLFVCGKDVDDVLPPEKVAEFRELFGKFLDEYPHTDDGRTHFSGYPSQREEAKENFQQIREMRDRGEDVTDAILLKLLPHSQTESNREKGAWCHFASVITGDIKKWFENAGWAREEDWPHIAEQIFTFVRDCVEEPAEYEAYCESFAESPYSKGLQSAFLSPILNALAPEHFAIVNSKSLKLIDSFSEESFSSQIREYPEANALLKQLASDLLSPVELEEKLTSRDLPQLSPEDVLDAFSHWLVTVHEKSSNGKPLIWKRESPDSYDLVLQNPEDLDTVKLAEMISRVGGKRGFATDAVEAFQRFIADPSQPLGHRAYVKLNNWFMGSEGEYRSSVTTDHAERTWDFLFSHRPPERLSSVEKNYEIIPEHFEKWWALMQGESARAWIFQANPERFDIREALRTRTLSTFHVSRYKDEIQEGDLVFIWESGSEGGIVGTARITSSPYEYSGETGADDEHWTSEAKRTVGTKVDLQVETDLDPPIGREVLKETPGLRQLSILKYAQGTNFTVDEEEAKILKQLVANRQSPSLWWVNQGRSHEQEREEGYLWASTPEESGRRISHHIAMEDLEQGNLVFHYSRGAIVALSRVQEPAAVEPRPGDDEDGSEGFLVRTEYYDLEEPIGLSEIPEPWRKKAGGPFNRVGEINQGYLYPLDSEFAWKLLRRFQDRLPRLEEVDIILEQRPPETGLFDRILEDLSHQGLYFPRELVGNYLLGLQAKRFVILTGISGTGKTKLATAVAKHFRPLIEESVPIDVPENAVEVEASPYMLKYRRIVLPVAVMDQFPPGTFRSDSEDRHVRLLFPGGHEDLSYWKDPAKKTTVINFRGAFWDWFSSSIEEGDTFLMEPKDSEEEETAPTIQLNLPERRSTQRHLVNHQIVAVRPDWTDNRGLLGYYNPLTNEYSSTPFLKLLMEARKEERRAQTTGRSPHPFFVVLDEMNLARVEHYFSDFLSCLESGAPLQLHNDDSLAEGGLEGRAISKSLTVPSNLFFTGTVNVDETTYMFSPKVLDRAFTIELNEVDLTQLGEGSDTEKSDLDLENLPNELRPVTNPSSEDWRDFGELEEGQLLEFVINLNDILAEENRHFGYRVANEVARFVNLAGEQAGTDYDTLWTALDLAILEKVLPKFHGTQQELQEVLLKLFDFCITSSPPSEESQFYKLEKAWTISKGRLVPRPKKESGESEAEEAEEASDSVASNDPVLPRTSAKIYRMLKKLERQGFTSFIE